MVGVGGAPVVVVVVVIVFFGVVRGVAFVREGVGGERVGEVV